jgi:hypothetical protein
VPRAAAPFVTVHRRVALPHSPNRMKTNSWPSLDQTASPPIIYYHDILP